MELSLIITGVVNLSAFRIIETAKCCHGILGCYIQYYLRLNCWLWPQQTGCENEGTSIVAHSPAVISLTAGGINEMYISWIKRVHFLRRLYPSSSPYTLYHFIELGSRFVFQSNSFITEYKHNRNSQTIAKFR